MGQDRRKRLVLMMIVLGMALLGVIVSGMGGVAASAGGVKPVAYLSLMVQPPVCPEASVNFYAAGGAHQYDLDNPVRPAWQHADKNLSLRGYTPNNDGTLQRQLINFGSDDPNQPPQFATLFKPARVPDLTGFYRVHEWIWAPSPDPGQRGAPIAWPEVTALGLGASFGETIYVPSSGYNIGGGMEVLILYADEHSVTLRYTREDSSGAAGYSVFISNICTDPKLLALYRQTDRSNGPRYTYVPPGNRPYVYDLPNLPAGKPLGTVIAGEVVVSISDTGRFWDPRSCNEWWQIRPGYNGGCPAPR
jgi:hypothetical protein